MGIFKFCCFGQRGLIWNSGKLRKKNGDLISSGLPNGNRGFFCKDGDQFTLQHQEENPNLK